MGRKSRYKRKSVHQLKYAGDIGKAVSISTRLGGCSEGVIVGCMRFKIAVQFNNGLVRWFSKQRILAIGEDVWKLREESVSDDEVS